MPEPHEARDGVHEWPCGAVSIPASISRPALGPTGAAATAKKPAPLQPTHSH